LAFTLVLDDFDWTTESYLNLELETNIPAGSAGWIPLATGHAWEFQTGPAVDRFVVDSMGLAGDTVLYHITLDSWENGLHIASDQLVVSIDSLNDIHDESGAFTQLYPFSVEEWMLFEIGDTHLWSFDFQLPDLCLAYGDIWIPGGGCQYLTGFNFGTLINGCASVNSGGWTTIAVGTTVYGETWGSLTPLPVDPVAYLPEEVILKTYPNPFNSGLVIECEALATKAHSLEIFDLNGRRVRSFPPDTSTRIRWDGRSQSGSELPNGIYVVRLSGRTEIVSKKVILLK
jgi:hypothetical protein